MAPVKPASSWRRPLLPMALSASPVSLTTIRFFTAAICSASGSMRRLSSRRSSARWGPKRIVLLEANEYALYEIERRLPKEGDAVVVPVLGSVEDRQLVRRVIAGEGVDVIFHAAAHKHVPLLEANVLEGVRNNVF